MKKTESDDNPQIKEVLKALNHAKRRDILLYLKDLERLTSFSELMDYLDIDPKTSGQFSYHLKLLVTAQLLVKEDEKYKISPLGIKACSMLDLVDTSEHQDSVVQKISNSFKNISPLDQVIVSFEAFALILFFVPLTYALENSSLFGVLLFPIIVGLFLFGLITFYSYRKLQYIPSILVLLSIIWVIFLQSNQLKTAFMYLVSIFGAVFIYRALITSDSRTYQIMYFLVGITFLLFSTICGLYIIYGENWKKKLNTKIS